ncbi:hypothetical protein QC762_0077620 [Podospora pseudocomata]|uniref:Uncharacterized protein n=1 Tax=Podospora pseudocomata TaxID=2093779 RepID=A0ABR0GB30_9PEZI|nr:hypothetical protein QC762_0077620 [Podospora pseudocomata]
MSRQVPFVPLGAVLEVHNHHHETPPLGFPITYTTPPHPTEPLTQFSERLNRRSDWQPGRWPIRLGPTAHLEFRARGVWSGTQFKSSLLQTSSADLAKTCGT